MTRSRRHRILVFGAVLAVALAAAASVVSWVRRDPAEPVSRLVIATGPVGGVYREYGEGFATAVRAALPAASVEVLTTAASVENLRLVADGRADVGFVLADAAALAVAGEPPFTARQPVAAIARLYDNFTHLVVPAASAVERVADLRGVAVSTGADGSGTDLIAGRLLTMAGLDPAVDLDRRRLNLADSVQALRSGQIAAFFFSGGLPTRAIATLGGEFRLVGLAEFGPELRRQHGEFYTERSIPAATYNLGHEVPTISVPNLLVVNSAMPPAVASKLTRLLFNAKPHLVTVHPEAKRLHRRAATTTYPVPLHPGAADYYRDVKP